MSRSVLMLSLLACLGVAPGAAAADRDTVDQRRALHALLNAHEFAVDKRLFDNVGDEVVPLLIEVAGHPKEPVTVRGRAMAALRLYPAPETRRFLSSVLVEASLVGTPHGTLLRREALRSLARAFGESVVYVVAELRDDPEPPIREAVARALGDTGSPTARALLEAWLPHEPDLLVRVAVDESLTRLRRGGR